MESPGMPKQKILEALFRYEKSLKRTGIAAQQAPMSEKLSTLDRDTLIAHALFLCTRIRTLLSNDATYGEACYEFGFMRATLSGASEFTLGDVELSTAP